MDALNPTEFRSNTRNTCNEEVTVEGVGVSFIHDLLQKFAGNASGLDLSELNFDHGDSGWKMNDEQTFKELVQIVLHGLN